MKKFSSFALFCIFAIMASFFVSCQKEETIDPSPDPTSTFEIKTIDPGLIADTSAILKLQVTKPGNFKPYFMVSKQQDLTNPLTFELPPGEFGAPELLKVTATGLKPGTVYYCQAYATSGSTTAIGGIVSFTTTGGGGGLLIKLLPNEPPSVLQGVVDPSTGRRFTYSGNQVQELNPVTGDVIKTWTKPAQAGYGSFSDIAVMNDIVYLGQGSSSGSYGDLWELKLSTGTFSHKAMDGFDYVDRVERFGNRIYFAGGTFQLGFSSRSIGYTTGSTTQFLETKCQNNCLPSNFFTAGNNVFWLGDNGDGQGLQYIRTNGTIHSVLAASNKTTVDLLKYDGEEYLLTNNTPNYSVERFHSSTGAVTQLMITQGLTDYDQVVGLGVVDGRFVMVFSNKMFVANVGNTELKPHTVLGSKPIVNVFTIGERSWVQFAGSSETFEIKI